MSFFVLIWCLATLGFIALAMSMPRHQEQVLGREIGPACSGVAAAAGWVMLALSLAACLRGGSLSNMISYWLGVLTFSALAVALCLSYVSARIPVLAAGCVAGSLLSLGLMAA